MNPLGKFFVKTYAAAVSKSADKLTSKIRRKAYDMGWPTSISRHLVVAYENGQYKVEYPEQVKESVLTLEYGTQSTPPSPLMRTFIRSITDTGMREEVEKSLKKARFHF